MKIPGLLLLISLFVSSVCLPVFHVYSESETELSNEEFFFGVTFGGTKFSEAKLLIDKVKGYTNLFVVDNWDVATNETLLTEICDYAVDANLSVIVYFSFIFVNYTRSFGSLYNSSTWDDYGVEPFHIPWLISTEERWGDKFLGAYVLDEPGGSQIDVGHYSGFETGFSGRNHTTFEGVANYSDAADRFVYRVSRSYTSRLNDHSRDGSIPNSTGITIPVFTADYALYWFDYLAGYDAVLAEFGWDHDQIQHIALCRGAANVQEKDWGVIITWATNDPPYLASGEEMLQDMNIAYRSGAKYLAIFNYPQINPYGALTEEHFIAMETFWNQNHGSPTNVREKVDGEVAFVLPKDYGWAMRGGHDNIWGIWPPDELVPVIGEKMAALLDFYGLKLDIIYDDPQFDYTEEYAKIFFWNSTDIFSKISCDASSSGIILGDSVKVSGSVSPVMLTNVTIQISMDNGTLKNLTTTTSVSDGRYSLDWTPESIGSYELQASGEGDSSHTEGTSSLVFVTVSKILTTLAYSVSSSSINEGESVTVSGAINPPVSGKTLTLTYRKPDGSVLNRTVTTNSDGSFNDLYSPDAVGYWAVFASYEGDSTYAGVYSPEQSFELKSKPEPEVLPEPEAFPEPEVFPSWTMMVVGNAAAAVCIIGVVAWFLTRPTVQQWTTKSKVKANLIGQGRGTLEFIDNNIKFHVEKGRFRKRQELLREIPLSDIENMSRTGNEMIRITWKGITDIFIIEETDLDGKIFESIPETSFNQRRIFVNREAARQKREELTKILGVAIDIVDSLFNILMSLQGWVSWNRVEGFLDRSELDAMRLTNQQIKRLKLDFAKLSLAIKERLSEDASKEANSLLRSLYNYFSGLTSKNEFLKQVHPNYHDVKTTIRSYYLLNDILLAKIIGDKEVGRERRKLMMILDDLSKETNIKIDVVAIDLAIAKLDVEENREGIIKEIRAVFKQQLKELVTG